MCVYGKIVIITFVSIMFKKTTTTSSNVLSIYEGIPKPKTRIFSVLRSSFSENTVIVHSLFENNTILCVTNVSDTSSPYFGEIVYIS